MALILAMQVGRSFYVDDTRVEVDSMSAPNEVRLKVIGAMDQIYRVTPNQSTEVMPDVYVQLGLGSGANMIKLAIEAPRKKRILRDTLYDEAREA